LILLVVALFVPGPILVYNSAETSKIEAFVQSAGVDVPQRVGVQSQCADLVDVDDGEWVVHKLLANVHMQILINNSDSGLRHFGSIEFDLNE
jgi:hypothetical protein